MGGGSWDTAHYTSASSARKATKVDDFAYTKIATAVHSSLDPRRINKKPFGKLESRDSDEHPNSTPVLVTFDVTGSNRERAVIAQKKLPHLMELLNKYLTDPQVAIAANDDYKVEGINAIQISEFESDVRVDEHIRNIWLVGNGGGNMGESYDLLLYAAARKVVLDSVEKRKKKGYLFMYADEPFFYHVSKSEVREIYGDDIQGDIPIAEIIEEAQRNFNIFIVFPIGGYANAREQFVKLFGQESVIDAQSPDLICELIASVIGMYESKATADSIVTDLVHVGVSASDAKIVSTSLARIASDSHANLVPASAGSADRL